MESKDHIRNTNPDELLKTRDDQLEKNAEANDQELDFSTIDTSDTSDAIDTKDSVDATNLTDARELDASVLAGDGSEEQLDAGDIGKADWGDVDPQDTPGGSRSGMDPSGPGSAV